MKHTDKPIPTITSEDQQLEAKAERLLASEYFRYLDPLAKAVKGRTVVSSRSGNAGFLLNLSDGTWVAAFLAEDRLAYELGSGEPSSPTLSRLESEAVGDASRPLDYDHPYADESCDLAAQVRHSHGQPITGLAYGADCFNFCFPGGMELDTMLVMDPKGRKSLRVFWEQW